MKGETLSPTILVRANNASGWLGVFWVERRQKWEASYRWGDRNVYVGLFDTAEGAARARAEALARALSELAKEVAGQAQ